MKADESLSLIKQEFIRAKGLYPDFHSNHEGYAVLKEEIDELWDEIKKSKDVRGNTQIQKELIQVAAMAVRYLDNLC